MGNRRERSEGPLHVPRSGTQGLVTVSQVHRSRDRPGSRSPERRAVVRPSLLESSEGRPVPSSVQPPPGPEQVPDRCDRGPARGGDAPWAGTDSNRRAPRCKRGVLTARPPARHGHGVPRQVAAGPIAVGQFPELHPARSAGSRFIGEAFRVLRPGRSTGPGSPRAGSTPPIASPTARRRSNGSVRTWR